MARVRFTHDFDYRISRLSLKAYKAGKSYTVKRACADQAVTEGKAVEVEAPSRPAESTRRRRQAGPTS